MKLVRSLLAAAFAVVLILYIYSDFRMRSLGVKEGPEMTVESGVLEISVNDDDEVLLQGVRASDKLDGDLTDDVIVSGVSKLLYDNTAEVTYVVFDSHDNMATGKRRIRYTDYKRPEITLLKPLEFETKDATGLIGHFGASDVIDGDLSDSVRVSALVPTADSDRYFISVQVMNSMGDSARLKLPVLIAEDKEAPVISLSSYLVYLDKEAAFDAASYISSVVFKGSALSVDNVKITGEVDVNTPGTYYIYYECTAENHIGKTALTVSVR